MNTALRNYKQLITVTTKILIINGAFLTGLLCCRLGAVTQTPLTRCLLSVSQTDMRLADTHIYTYSHTKSLTPICTARLTLPDYGNRLSPRKTTDFPPKHGNTYPYKCTYTHRHTQQGFVSGEAPNCVALLEKWTLFYPLFTCRP